MKNISENFYASKLAQRTLKKNNSLLILAICTHGITADEQAQTSNKLWAKVIYPWTKKKKISSCTFMYLYVCLSENQTKRQMLSL